MNRKTPHPGPGFLGWPSGLASYILGPSNRNRKNLILGLGSWAGRLDWPLPWLSQPLSKSWDFEIHPILSGGHLGSVSGRNHVCCEGLVWPLSNHSPTASAGYWISTSPPRPGTLPWFSPLLYIYRTNTTYQKGLCCFLWA